MIDNKPGQLCDTTKSDMSVSLPERNSFAFDMYHHSRTFTNIYHLLTDQNSAQELGTKQVNSSGGRPQNSGHIHSSLIIAGA